MLPKDKWVKCSRCRRWLKDPHSVQLGLGTKCARLLGMDPASQRAVSVAKLLANQLSLFPETDVTPNHTP